MRYLNKVIFLNSAHIPYAEIRMDGNVHFIGTQGVGKSTLLRAILFFYNADKLHLGIPKEKQNFDAFYLPYANSYIVYEVVRENSAYSVVVSKSMGRAAFRLIDAPYRKAWFVNDRHEVSADWSEVRTRILESDARCTITPLVTSYEMFRDIIFGNNRKPDMVSYRKFAIVESSKYQNIPRTIQHVFLNSRLDADFVKDTIIQSMNEEDVSIDLTYYRSQIEAFEQEYDDVMRWLRPNKNGEIVVRKQAEQVIQRYRSLLYSQKQLEEGRAELNYAEKAAHDMLPVLEEQIQEAEEKRARLVRLVGEERGKYSAERDKLVRREGAIADDLKRIREKRLYYEKEGIEEVMRRVAGEAALLHEQDSLKQTYAELTATYRDVLQKYDLLVGKVEAAFTAFENERRKAVLARENELNVWRNEFIANNIKSRKKRIADFAERWYSDKDKQETYEELESLLVLDKQCCHTARIILESGQIDSEEKNNCGKTPFLIAAERGAWKIGALLSGQEPETDELAAITGGLNLFQALWYGAEEALDALLRSGADTQVVCEDNGMTDFKGKSPLGCALTWENFSAAELLLRGGADPNFRDSEERTAFAVWMSNRGHGCEYKEPCLHFLQCLTVCGWDLESPADKEGNTALSVACRGAKYDTGIWAVRYLVENGADVNAHNMQGQTPAMNLYGGRYWDGNIPRFSGFARSYPYDGRACTEQDAETLEVLLEAGADINVKDKWGNTLLHYIAGSSMRGSKEATELVMEFGTPDVSAVNNEGLTALDIAAKKNDETLVKFLLKYS